MFGLLHSIQLIYDTNRLRSSPHLFDRVFDWPFLRRFRVVTRLSARGQPSSVSGMSPFSIGAIPATWDFAKPSFYEILDKVSDLSGHCCIFNLRRKPFDA